MLKYLMSLLTALTLTSCSCEPVVQDKLVYVNIPVTCEVPATTPPVLDANSTLQEKFVKVLVYIVDLKQSIKTCQNK